MSIPAPWILAAVCTVGLIAIPAHADDSKPTALPAQDPMAGLDDVSILKKGDQLSITILEKGSTPFVLQVSTKAPGAGNIQFPYIGLVQAEGLTPRALATKCKGHLEKYFFKPATVIIELKDPNEGRPAPGGPC